MGCAQKVIMVESAVCEYVESAVNEGRPIGSLPRGSVMGNRFAID